MAIHVLIKSENTTHKFRVIGTPTTIGRSSKCNLTIPDPLISGQHLSVFLGPDGRVVIKDLESTNGLYLNGSRVEDTALYLDDVIQFGNNFLKIDAKEMNERERSLHTKDYEKTNVTFVNMTPEFNSNFADNIEPNPKQKKKTLLGELRKKKLAESLQEGEIRRSRLAEKKEKSDSLQIESRKVKKK